MYSRPRKGGLKLAQLGGKTAELATAPRRAAAAATQTDKQTDRQTDGRTGKVSSSGRLAAGRVVACSDGRAVKEENDSLRFAVWLLLLLLLRLPGLTPRIHKYIHTYIYKFI